MEKIALILIGGGGHCKACIDVIEWEGNFTIAGVLDTQDKIGEQVLGYPILGTDEDIPNLIKEGYAFLITVGQIKSTELRKKLYDKLKSLNAKLATVISPYAVVSKHTKIEEGTIIMHTATVNASVMIGVNCIINTGSNIEHDVILGKHCHISTHAVINGNCTLGDEVFLGSGTIVSNGLTIFNEVVLGAGSLVYKSINERGTFAGNPLRKI